MKPVKLFDDYLAMHAAALNMTREEYAAHYLSESKDSDTLAKEIDKAIIKIDDSMSYKDFAAAVAKVLRDDYGKHLYKSFIEELNNQL
jgi:ribonuclease HII